MPGLLLGVGDEGGDPAEFATQNAVQLYSFVGSGTHVLELPETAQVGSLAFVIVCQLDAGVGVATQGGAFISVEGSGIGDRFVSGVRYSCWSRELTSADINTVGHEREITFTNAQNNCGALVFIVDNAGSYNFISFFSAASGDLTLPAFDPGLAPRGALVLMAQDDNGKTDVPMLADWDNAYTANGVPWMRFYARTRLDSVPTGAGGTFTPFTPTYDKAGFAVGFDT